MRARTIAAFDLAVTGGTLVTPHGMVAGTLAVRGGRIAAWLAPDLVPDAAERIDAAGRLVLPGLVDAHVHFREPGLVHKEGFRSGSMAAAAGGVTTVMVMPTDNPFTTTPTEFEAKRRLAEGQIHVDVALQAAVARDPAAVAALADLGAVSFEIFLGDIPADLLTADAGDLHGILEAIGSAGGSAGVTPADDTVIARALAAARAGPPDPLAFFRSRPPLSEAVGTARACAVAREVGVHTHLRQVSCRASLDIVAAARATNPRLSAEVTPHNLLLTEDELVRQGPFAKVLPPLRQPDDLAALWAALRAGTLDIVATDHAPHAPAEKAAGHEDIWKAPGGLPGVQTLLPLLIGAVADGRLGWSDLVRIASETPARLFGLHPRKGHLGVGADADLVLVDPHRPLTIRNEDQLSKAQITPFAGRTVAGAPVLALLRGRVVMRDGRVVEQPAGEIIARRSSRH